jgi:hypothetical protein
MIDRFLWYGDFWKCIHGALHRITLDSFDLVEQLRDQFALFFKSVQDLGLFLNYFNWIQKIHELYIK